MTSTSKLGYDLYNLLTNAGFKDLYSRFIVSQAAHECGNFTSDVFLKNNNPFGIKYFGQAEADGELNGYAYYKNMGRAVQDYERIFKTYGIIIGLNSLDNFVDLLKKHNYFEAPQDEYLRGCTWFYNLYFPKDWKVPIKKPSGSW